MRTLELTDDEFDALWGIVVSWVGEGFTTPPYNDAIYGILEKLGIAGEVSGYGVDRPA